jgi:hypothetical protein
MVELTPRVVTKFETIDKREVRLQEKCKLSTRPSTILFYACYNFLLPLLFLIWETMFYKLTCCWLLRFRVFDKENL